MFEAWYFVDSQAEPPTRAVRLESYEEEKEKG